ncbi:hypothetical protein G9X64_35335 [Rhizobium sophorae]|uniref:Cation-transporting P-type ATPase N-terminal domain-containing protein n=1 Tax=Rhizobium sophorae TaxID=1535242 RepID=A0A7Y3WIW8_9HYPH|nr:cation-transporting P-type ATPase [Rhizobium sophorae]MBX4859314.1 hypothetical protein [Rhizobium bangladeshense]NKK70870.1 hypothetical protein [Rhizobium leguminosarum bv. viciae]NNU41668.1 hypothetical protein [Rhizobium sophorae]
MTGFGCYRAAGPTSLGPTTAEAEERVRRFGPNSLSDESREGMLADFARQFKSPLVLVFGALQHYHREMDTRKEATRMSLARSPH